MAALSLMILVSPRAARAQTPAPSPEAMWFDNHLDHAVFGSLLTDVADHRYFKTVVIQIVWGEIEANAPDSNGVHTYDFNDVNAEMNFWIAEDANVEFILRFAPYASSGGGDLVPAWIYDSAHGGVEKLVGPSSIEIPKVWVSKTGANNDYLDLYTTFVDRVATEYDGNSRVKFAWAGAGHLGYSTVAASDEWTSYIERDESWSPTVWRDYVNSVRTMFDAEFTKPVIFGVTSVVTATLSGDRIAPLWTDVAQDVLDDGQVLAVSGFDEDDSIYWSRELSQVLCGLSTDASDKIVFRDDFPLYYCADPNSERDEDDFGKILRRMQLEWDRHDNAFELYVMGLDDDYEATDNTFTCFNADASDHLDDFMAGADVSPPTEPLLAPCTAKRVYVDGDLTTGNDNGTSWANAYQDLATAIATEFDWNTEIWVAATTTPYTPGTTRDATFALKPGVRVYGGFDGSETSLSQRDVAGNVTVLSGDINVGSDPDADSYHVVTIAGNSASVVLDGFTITKGRADVAGSDRNIGGGILIQASNAKPLIANCTIADNYAEKQGAGVYANKANSIFLNCSFSENYAAGSTDGHGGGLFINAGWATYLQNCLFFDNEADQKGGAIYVQCDASINPVVKIINCTVAQNEADTVGAGLWMDKDCDVRVWNSVFWDNRKTGFAAGITTQSIQIYRDTASGVGSLEVWNSCIYTNGVALTGSSFTSKNNITDDPDFSNPAGNVFSLQGTSPCIDAGADKYVLVLDFADLDEDGEFVETTPLDLGWLGRLSSTVDMGAYEYHAP